MLNQLPSIAESELRWHQPGQVTLTIPDYLHPIRACTDSHVLFFLYQTEARVLACTREYAWVCVFPKLFHFLHNLLIMEPTCGAVLTVFTAVTFHDVISHLRIPSPQNKHNPTALRNRDNDPKDLLGEKNKINQLV